jgi:hypothetical protein
MEQARNASHTFNLSNLGRYQEIGPFRFKRHRRAFWATSEGVSALSGVYLSLGHEDGFAHFQV